MRIYPAVHYTMGGLWVDYNLMSTIPGLHVAGEANFSDHGANRLGASALMQGLADGYFVLPYTIGDYIASNKLAKVEPTHQEFRAAEEAVRAQQTRLLSIRGKRTVDSFHKELGKIMWDNCGMARTREGLTRALELIPTLKEEFWQNVNVPGSGDSLNQSLEKAGRVADFIEFGELMCPSTPSNARSRAEDTSATNTRREDGEAKRNDDRVRLRRGVGIRRAKARRPS